jgi:hypothetical protein
MNGGGGGRNALRTIAPGEVLAPGDVLTPGEVLECVSAAFARLANPATAIPRPLASPERGVRWVKRNKCTMQRQPERQHKIRCP